MELVTIFGREIPVQLAFIYGGILLLITGLFFTVFVESVLIVYETKKKQLEEKGTKWVN